MKEWKKNKKKMGKSGKELLVTVFPYVHLHLMGFDSGFITVKPLKKR